MALPARRGACIGLAASLALASGLSSPGGPLPESATAAVGTPSSADRGYSRGGVIVFVRNPEFGEIWRVIGDGRQQRRLAGARGVVSDEEPVWSPSGERIVFIRQLSGWDRDEEERSALYVVNGDGSRLRRLTPPTAVTFSSLSWSPDGRSIAYGTSAYGSQEKHTTTITTMSVDTGVARQLIAASGSTGVYDPQWSPVGRRIVFGKGGPVDVAAVYSMNADASDQRRLATGACVRRPSWSPDGRRIAYAASKECGGWAQINVMNANGTGRRTLATNATTDGPLAWSPDSRTLVYAGGSEDLYELYSVTVDGKVKRALTHGLGYESSPAWSPDGRLIAFARAATEGTDLWVMTATGGNQRLAATDGGQPTWKPRPSCSSQTRC